MTAYVNLVSVRCLEKTRKRDESILRLQESGLRILASPAEEEGNKIIHPIYIFDPLPAPGRESRVVGVSGSSFRLENYDDEEGSFARIAGVQTAV